MILGTATVLLIASDDAVQRCLASMSGRLRCEIAAATRSTLSRFFEHSYPSLVVIGPNVANPWDVLHLTRLVHEWAPCVPIVIVTSQGSEDLAVAAMRAGVSDYFRSPIDPGDLVGGVSRLLGESGNAAESGTGYVARGPAAQEAALVGLSPAACSIRNTIVKIASTDTTTLITGETGTGKELAARMIHSVSRRSSRPFVSINCAAIPEALVESELFGYERGAFTGAGAPSGGRMLAAHRGTAFFDEVGDLSPAAQAKVLRLVEDKEVHRLGATGSVRVDARIVAATNRNLEELVSGGSFRSDLYFRLNVARVHLPALRERREDIPLLLTHYLHNIRDRLRRNVDAFTADALDALTQYHWPGNIRELKNLIERLIIDASSNRIDLQDLPKEMRSPRVSHADAASMERTRLLSALSLANWNKSAAARSLGCSRMTLYRKIGKYQLRMQAASVVPARAH